MKFTPDHQFAPIGAKECPNRPENPINRKRTNFCFEITSQKISSSGRILDDLLKHYTIGMLTLMIRRSAYDQLERGFDPRFSVIGDFDIVIRLAAQWESDYVDEPVAYCLWHADNFSNTHPQMSCDELEEWYEDIKQDFKRRKTKTKPHNIFFN